MAISETTIGFWVGQRLHFVSIIVLLLLVYFSWSLIDSPFPILFWSTVAVPVVHQIYVWVAWRLELRSNTISKAIGFRGYFAIFIVLFSSRFISLLTLAWVDRGSLNLDIVVLAILTISLTLPGVYAVYSVKRYFGIARATGADHFDTRFRKMPLVKKGIFRFTSNGMYLYAFFLFWAIATGFNSSAAIIVAAFSHIYIWVHFYATEKPDMDFIYNTTIKSIR